MLPMDTMKSVILWIVAALVLITLFVKLTATGNGGGSIFAEIQKFVRG